MRRKHRYCIAEDEAVIVYDHDPRGAGRLTAVHLRRAIRNNVGALDLSYGQPKFSRRAAPLMACQDQSPPTLFGKAV